MTVGFIGLGVMGRPMALNIVRGGVDLIVWNRSEPALDVLRDAGARIAGTVDEVFAAAEIVVVMLATEAAMDEVLGRGTARFAARLAGRTLVHMGTTSLEYSRLLESAVLAAGGRYVEAPVSGSRVPAEAGQLVGMLAGDPAAVDAVRPVVELMCATTTVCGPVPGALTMKFAVNLFLIATVTGLAEAVHFAEQHAVDGARLLEVLDAGQMASPISRVKSRKLVDRDLSVQAGITDVLKNNRLIAEAARQACIATPLLDVCYALYAETAAAGDGALDMAAVIHAVEARTAALIR